MSPSTTRVLVILLLGLAVRLPLMTTAGFEDDVRMYETWSWKAATRGIHTLYLDSDRVKSDNHPACLYPFKVIGKIYMLAAGLDEFPFPEQSSRLHRFLLRWPATACDFLLGWLLYGLARRRSSEKVSALVLAGFLFNPAVIFDSAVYGQIDALHSLLALAAIALLQTNSPVWGWAALGAAFMTKPQTYVLAPIFLIAAWRRSGKRGLILGIPAALGGMIAVAAPFIFYGTQSSLIAYFSGMFSVHPVVSLFGDNLWWLLMGARAAVTPDLDPVPLLARLGILVSYRAVGLALMTALQVIVWRALWRNPRPPELFAWAGASVLVFFAASTQMHENYLYLAVPLLAAAAAQDSRKNLLYALVSAAFTANMLWHYPAFIQWSGAGETPLAALRAATAVLVLGLTGWTLWTLSQEAAEKKARSLV